jgi:Kef-type K+ transport system membrane component KefB
MSPFTAAPHHDVLVLLVQVALLLIAARAMGEVAQRLRQPSVVGEILAGILLGPSLLSGLFPALGAWIVPQSAVGGYLLEVVSLLGALFLLLITGLETDLGLIRQHARTAMGVSLGGILVTFSSGFALGWYLPDDLLARPGEGFRLVFALFVATAMSISAIPVIAKVLMDMNLMRRDVGQTIIAAGMSDDTIGWILLSIVAGLAGTGAVTGGAVFQAVGSVVIFMVASFTVGRWLVKRALDFVQDEVRSPDRLVTLVIALTILWGAVTQALGLEAVLGAFVMGILFGQMPRLPHEVHHKLITLSLAVFTPVFFAVAGLKVDARALLEPRLLLMTLLVIAVASGGKIVGTYLGARLIGRRDHWTSLSFGAGLNARGAMEIIIATIGLELGILSQDMFSIIVIMAMVTSLMAPPALRWVLGRVQPEAQELERLRREELAAGSFSAGLRRVLLPVRLRPGPDVGHSIESYVVGRLTEHATKALTLLTVTSSAERAQGTEFLSRLAPRFERVDLTQKVVVGTAPGEAILQEAQKDYDLLILGATEPKPGTGSVFHPLVDEMVRMAPCPSIVVRPARGAGNWPPRQILVPTNGSRAARNAAELGFALAGHESEVLVLHAIQRKSDAYLLGPARAQRNREHENATQIIEELQALGASHGVRTEGIVQTASDAETAVLNTIHAHGVDLVILGTDVRPASERLFLGPRVERILAAVPCPALVVNTA